MSVCARCGAANAATARFCAHCGAELTATCVQCGEPLPAGARFCPSCGHQYAESPPAGDERKVVTVLFADVIGSTGLGDQLDPEQIKELMGAYFSAMREEIEGEGGTVEKFIGDAVMAAFGVPVAHEDDRLRALRAALRMRTRLASLNETLSESHGVALQMRMGINTGEVVASAAPQPGEGMVAGDAVNVAARLEQAAEPGQIVVSERTARTVAGFKFRPLGQLALKGKGKAVAALELIAEQPGEQRGIPGLRAPIVGRDRELALLGALLDRVAAELRPQLVTIYGDAGVGKSRLTAEFLASADAASPLVMRGRCLPYGDGVTYWPLAEILKTYAEVLDSDEPEVVLTKIEDTACPLLTAAGVPDVERASAALAYTAGIEHPRFSFRDLAPRQVCSEMQQAWRALFSELAAEHPLIFVIEDIHWADPALLSLIQDIADRVQGPLLLLCTSRPDLTSRHPEWGGGRRNFSSIFLEPLSGADAGHLMTALLAVDDIPDTTRMRILDRAEGNPFFLEEIVRQLIDANKIVRSERGWRAVSDIRNVEIPDTVQEVLAARLDLLPPADKRVLQLAAVVGRTFWTTPIQQLLNGEASQLDDVLDHLQDRELVLARMGSTLAGEREFSFKHILTRDVAYASLPRRDRGRAHQAVAQWIEKTAGERRLEMVELLAYHYGEAHRAAREREAPESEALRRHAFDTLVAASVDSRSKLASARAHRLGAQALEIAQGDRERAIALEAMGAAAFDQADGDEAWRCYRTAADARIAVGAESPDDRAALAKACARACDIPTRWPGSMRFNVTTDAVRPYLDRGLATVGDADSENAVQLLTAKAFWPWSFTSVGASPDIREDEARAAGEAAVAMAQRLGRLDLESGALDALASSYIFELRVAEQSAIIDRRLALGQRLNDLAEFGDIQCMAAWVRFDIGLYSGALLVAEEGLKRTREQMPWVAAHCANWKSLAQYRLGEWDNALASFDDLRTLLGERGDDPQYYATRAFATTAAIHDERGNRESADRLIAILARLRSGSQRAGPIYHWLAVLFSRRGDAQQAWDYLGSGDDPGQLTSPATFLESACDVVAELGAWERAGEVLEKARAMAAQGGLLALTNYAARLEGRAALAGGDVPRAAALLERAAAGFADIGARWEAAVTRLDLARAYHRQDDAKHATSDLASAVATFEELGALRDLQRARHAFDA